MRGGGGRGAPLPNVRKKKEKLFPFFCSRFALPRNIKQPLFALPQPHPPPLPTDLPVPHVLLQQQQKHFRSDESLFFCFQTDFGSSVQLPLPPLSPPFEITRRLVVK